MGLTVLSFRTLIARSISGKRSTTIPRKSCGLLRRRHLTELSVSREPWPASLSEIDTLGDQRGPCQGRPITWPSLICATWLLTPSPVRNLPGCSRAFIDASLRSLRLWLVKAGRGSSHGALRHGALRTLDYEQPRWGVSEVRGTGSEHVREP